MTVRAESEAVAADWLTAFKAFTTLGELESAASLLSPLAAGAHTETGTGTGTGSSIFLSHDHGLHVQERPEGAGGAIGCNNTPTLPAGTALPQATGTTLYPAVGLRKKQRTTAEEIRGLFRSEYRQQRKSQNQLLLPSKQILKQKKTTKKEKHQQNQKQQQQQEKKQKPDYPTIRRLSRSNSLNLNFSPGLQSTAPSLSQPLTIEI